MFKCEHISRLSGQVVKVAGHSLKLKHSSIGNFRLRGFAVLLRQGVFFKIYIRHLIDTLDA